MVSQPLGKLRILVLHHWYPFHAPVKPAHRDTRVAGCGCSAAAWVGPALPRTVSGITLAPSMSVTSACGLQHGQLPSTQGFGNAWLPVALASASCIWRMH